MQSAKVAGLNNITLSSELSNHFLQLIFAHHPHLLNKMLQNLLLNYLHQKLPGRVPAWFSDSLPAIMELFNLLDAAAEEADLLQASKIYQHL